jgi:hypothetical protein
MSDTSLFRQDFRVVSIATVLIQADRAIVNAMVAALTLLGFDLPPSGQNAVFHEVMRRTPEAPLLDVKDMVELACNRL